MHSLFSAQNGSPHPCLQRIVFIKKILSFISSQPQPQQKQKQEQQNETTHTKDSAKNNNNDDKIIASQLQAAARFASVSSSWDDTIWNYGCLSEGILWPKIEKSCRVEVTNNETTTRNDRKHGTTTVLNTAFSCDASPLPSSSSLLLFRESRFHFEEQERKRRERYDPDFEECDDFAPPATFEGVFRVFENCCVSPESIRWTSRLRRELFRTFFCPLFFVESLFFVVEDEGDQQNRQQRQQPADSNAIRSALRMILTEYNRLFHRRVLPFEVRASNRGHSVHRGNSTTTEFVWIQHLGFDAVPLLSLSHPSSYSHKTKDFASLVKIFTSSRPEVKETKHDERSLAQQQKQQKQLMHLQQEVDITDDSSFFSVSPSYIGSLRLTKHRHGAVLNRTCVAGHAPKQPCDLCVNTHAFSNASGSVTNGDSLFCLIAVGYEMLHVGIFSTVNGKCLHFLNVAHSAYDQLPKTTFGSMQDLHSTADPNRILGQKYFGSTSLYERQISKLCFSLNNEYLFCAAEAPWGSIFVVDVKRGVVIQEAYVPTQSPETTLKSNGSENDDDDDDDVEGKKHKKTATVNKSNDSTSSSSSPSSLRGLLPSMFKRKKEKKEQLPSTSSSRSTAPATFNPNAIHEVKLTPNGKFLVTFSHCRSLNLWSVAQEEHARQKQEQEPGRQKQILSLVRTIPISQIVPSSSIPAATPASSFIFTSDSTTMFLSVGKSIYSFHFDENQQQFTPFHLCRGGVSPLVTSYSSCQTIRDFALSYDNTLLVTTCSEGGGATAMKVHNVLTCAEEGFGFQRNGPEEKTKNIPSSSLVVDYGYGGGDGQQIWHCGTIFSVNFAPKSNTIIVTVSQDKTAKIWDCKRGVLLRTITEMGTFGSCASFTWAPTCPVFGGSASLSPVPPTSSMILAVSKFRGRKISRSARDQMTDVHPFNFGPEGPVMFYSATHRMNTARRSIISNNISNNNIDLSSPGITTIAEEVVQPPPPPPREGLVDSLAEIAFAYFKNHIVRMDFIEENLLEVESLNGFIRQFRVTSGFSRSSTQGAKSDDDNDIIQGLRERALVQLDEMKTRKKGDLSKEAAQIATAGATQPQVIALASESQGGVFKKLWARRK